MAMDKDIQMVKEKERDRIVKLLLTVNALLFIVSIGLAYITVYQPHLFLNRQGFKLYLFLIFFIFFIMVVLGIIGAYLINFLASKGTKGEYNG